MAHRKPIVTKKTPSGCHICVSHYQNPDGYIRVRRKGRTVGLHVAIYEEHHGPIPAGQVVRHRCNNPPCINPAHLIAGTQGENVNDSVVAGTHYVPPSLKGESRPGSKLTIADVQDIHRLHGSGMSHTAIAQRFPVTRQTISKIIAGRLWASVDATLTIR